MVIRLIDPERPDRWPHVLRLVRCYFWSRCPSWWQQCDREDALQDAICGALVRWRRAQERGEDCPHLCGSVARWAVVDACRGGKGCYRTRGAVVRGRRVLVSSEAVRLGLDAKY